MGTHELIKKARSRAGLSQSALAKRVGTTQSAIARWESGHVSPRVVTLERLLKACGFDLEFSMLRSDDQDRRQILERLQWTPKERLDYLVDMIAFEEAAHRARPLKTH